MPTEIKLQWHKATKRWRKKIGGKDYYFEGGKGSCKTNMAGYRQAFTEYLALCDTIEQKSVPVGQVSSADKARWLSATGQQFEASELRQTIAANEKAKQQGEYQPAETNDFQNVSGSHFFNEDNANWRERIHTLNSIQPDGNSVGLSDAIQLFLSAKRLAATGENLSAGRFDFLSRVLGIALEQIQNIPVNSINGFTLTNFHSFISNRKDWSKDYQKSIWIIWRQFVNWSWENELLDNLPRNYNSKVFKFKSLKGVKEKEVFDKKTIQTIMEKGNDKIKLWVLLALNCGFTQVDISDLDKSEVDWEEGRITRKRSKTASAEGTPVVSYKLWDITLQLLKQQKAKRGNKVLTTANGTPYVVSTLTPEGKYHRKDVLARTFYLWQVTHLGSKQAFKMLRKTACTELNGSDYRDMRNYFLGHSPRTMAEKHYDVDSPAFQARMDKTVDFIRQSLDIK